MAKKNLKPTATALISKLNKAHGKKGNIKTIRFKTAGKNQKMNGVLAGDGLAHLEVAKVDINPLAKVCKKYAPIIVDGKIVGYKCVLWG